LHTMHAAIQYLKVDILALSIAIHPQYNKIGATSASFQVPNNALALSLLDNGRCKELGRVNSIPTLILGMKVNREDVACHRGDPVFAFASVWSFGKRGSSELVHSHAFPAARGIISPR
jgi:hypothetical protein